MLKTCSKCGIEKPATTQYFYGNKRSKDGVRADCKDCNKNSYGETKKRYEASRAAAKIEYLKLYRANNSEKLKEKRKQYVKKNKEKIREYYKVYHVVNADKMKVYRDKSYSLNKSKKFAREKIRRSTDIDYRLTCALRSRLNKVVTHGYKSAKTLELLGCSVEYLKQHLENKFDGVMSWDNYGSYWHIDHIRPCASFDLKDEEQQKQCFHYSNLQPLEAIENIIKGAKWSS